MNGTPRTFHTGIDATMITILVVSVAPVLVLPIVDAKARTPVLYVVAALVVLLFWYLYRSTHYTFEDTQLVVRCGPIREELSYESIRSAAYSSSWMSGYAMSLKRIEIAYNSYDKMLISPDDRAAFLEELVRRAAHVAVSGSE